MRKRDILEYNNKEIFQKTTSKRYSRKQQQIDILEYNNKEIFQKTATKRYSRKQQQTKKQKTKGIKEKI